MKSPPCVLTIAGSDSGAGAGIQADARTIHALGGYACTAISAITAQNTRGVTAWRAVSPAFVTAQITAVLDDLPIAAIKTGLLSGGPGVRAVVRALEKYPRIPLVIDPVIESTSGTRFLSAAGVRALKRELLPRAALITPNWPEAEMLVGRPVRTFAQAAEAAQTLSAESGSAVLVKGGHAPGGLCRDCLVTNDGRVRWFEGRRVATRNTHGTGCVLSAAIATEVARGAKLEQAVKKAHAFLQRCLHEGREVRWGGGRGPAFGGGC
jgi:hydroxymethylpyrimidine/phosphomethylpyrimidine kinase